MKHMGLFQCSGKALTALPLWIADPDSAFAVYCYLSAPCLAASLWQRWGLIGTSACVRFWTLDQRDGFRFWGRLIWVIGHAPTALLRFGPLWTAFLRSIGPLGPH
jgi:hypothetical protein